MVASKKKKNQPLDIPDKRWRKQIKTTSNLRNVSLSEEDVPHRKSSSGTVRSEGGVSQYISKHGILPIYDSTDSLDSRRSSSGMKIRRIPSLLDGSTRFPKLEECAHFHYDVVELGPIEVHLCDDDRENYHYNDEERGEDTFLIQVKSNEKAWNIRRTFCNFRNLDKQLHRCIFDRKFSQLAELQRQDEEKENTDLRRLLRRYMERFSYLAGSMLNCGSVLNWLELDNRGNRLLAVDDSGINTPAIAAAHAIKRYNSQAIDEISLEVGDIVSVIDMPPPDDTIWWRGKRGFEVGFFPGECVEVIGDKVPHSVATRILRGAASRKPLIRRHGKLMSFLRTFFSTRPARNQLKQSGIVKERVFGCDLGEHLLNSGHDVPLVLKSCTDVIERHGIVDGIYRLSGITSNIQKLRLAFDEDSVPDLCDDCYLQDIHSISSLLKMYLRELPNPLLTYQLYDKFADAVRDEDNKLLRIHDVVQQLPPPHYRTTEFLMKHLARVAAHGHETGMHSKNLAIVWAPNLLRSKELEMGGGAAALQGVGIQAVVTECLICYSDIIFSDKMPSYSSPELQKAYKKPRPKSLAISTPTRLLSLEEARERAFVGGLIPVSQKFIDVGGGPDSLPAKYHTVIDLPGYKKKSVSTKTKKSPVSGWKSIFSKPRSGSIKKARKSSIQDNLNIPPVQGKALTEEDVHNWKKRLRSAKSAESLLSLASSNRSSGSRIAKAPENAMVLNVYKEERPHHKRSLSSDATAILHHHSHNPIFIESGREMPIDVDMSIVPHVMEDEEMSPRKSRPMKRDDPGKGSFIRGDSSRMALHHRRTPSAPNTPNQERNAAKSRQVSAQQKALSQPALESPSQVQRRQIYTYIHSSEESLNGEHVFHSDTGHTKYSNKSIEEINSQKHSAKTPPKGRKKMRDNLPENMSMSNAKDEVIKLQESPGVHRKVLSSDISPKTSDSTPTQYFYSRTHDYAEIMSDEDKKLNTSFRDSDILCSPCDMRDFIEHIDNKFAKHKQSGSYVDDSPEKLDRLSNGSQSAWQNNEQFNRRLNDESFDYAQVYKESSKQNGTQTSPTVAGLDYSRIDSRKAQNFKNSNTSANSINESSQIHTSSSKNKMSKCLSVPSDIAKSLENINVGSNMDLMSSVTISELSQSVDSFNHSFNEDSRTVKDPRRRRSASCDSLNATDSPLCRTLREINQQIDKAFQQNVDRALLMEDEGYKRHGHSADDLQSLNISQSFPAVVGHRASTHGSFEIVPDFKKSPLDEHHEKISSHNPAFLSCIPLDLFENNATEVSKNSAKIQRSRSSDQSLDVNVAGIYCRHDSSSDSSEDLGKVNFNKHLDDQPSLHSQYVISGLAMFPTEIDQTQPFPTNIHNPQSYPQQIQERELLRNNGSSDIPDYARINKIRISPTIAPTHPHHSDASSQIFVEEYQSSSNPVLYNVSHDRQNNESPVYCQINRASPQTVSSPSSIDASPRPSPRSSPRNLQPSLQQQPPVSPNMFKKSTLPQSPMVDNWQTPRTFRRSDDGSMITDHNITCLSQSLNLSHDQIINNQIHTSTSLPEVHVHQSTLTEQKPTIKKLTTESQMMDTIIQNELESCFNTDTVQSSYTPVPKPRKIVSESRQKTEAIGDNRMTIDDIKQAHKTVKEGEKVLQMLDSSNAGKKLQDLVIEQIDIPVPTNVYQQQKEVYNTQADVFPTQAEVYTDVNSEQKHFYPTQMDAFPKQKDVYFPHQNVHQNPKDVYFPHQNVHQTPKDVYKPQTDADPSRIDFFQTQSDVYQQQTEFYQPQADVYQTPIDSYSEPSPINFFSPKQRFTEPPANVVMEESNRMTIADIKQAHKTVKEGEKALQMMDTSIAGKKLEDVMLEHLHVDVDYSSNQQNTYPEYTEILSKSKPRQIEIMSEQIDFVPRDKQLTSEHNYYPNQSQDLFKPLQVITEPDEIMSQHMDFVHGSKFMKVQPEQEEILYREPIVVSAPRNTTLSKPMEVESDRMTFEDIQNAHKAVQAGEKVLQMLDTSNAGRKMEDLIWEQLDVAQSNSRSESLSYKKEVPSQYSESEANNMQQFQNQMPSSNYRSEMPTSYSNHEVSMSGYHSEMPTSYSNNEVFRHERPSNFRNDDVRRKEVMFAGNDDDPMTIDDIKRAHKTVKHGEKMLNKLDTSNAGKKLEDVLLEHIDVGSQSKKKLRSTPDSEDNAIETPSKMSNSYSEFSSPKQSQNKMSNSWSGSSTTSNKPDKSIFIPADRLPATLIESRCEKSAPSPIGEVTESQLLRVESFGDIDEEEFQNVINRGKAIIMDDKREIDSKLLTSPNLQKNASHDCRVLPQQPVAVCRASDVSNVNVPHGDILRAPSFISSAASKPYVPIPSPKARTSIKTCSNDIPPPQKEVIEMTRQSVMIGNKKKMHKEDDGYVIVQDIKGDAKLVIEKKNMKMVHAQKVLHPPRHLAEGVDDTSDSLTPDMSSTGPSDADPSGLSSTDDDVFSDINEGSLARRNRQLIENRDFDFRASLGKMERVSSDSLKIPYKVVDEMISSRSSLDESLLIIAAERHDIFGPEGDEEPGYSSGSLRVKRSQKLKSLVELFESVSDNNDSDSSSPSARPKDRRHMTSSQPSILTHSSDTSSKYEADTDDESTPTRARPSSFRHRSRSRSRDRARKNTTGIGSDKENRLQSRSPTPNRKLLGSDRPSSSQGLPSDNSLDFRSRKQKTKSEKYSSIGKPPKYRSNSRNRTHSESSTSESEGSLHHDQALILRLAESEVILRDQNRSDLSSESVDFLETVERRARLVRKCSEEGFPERCDLQRRGSIKELRDFFECRKADLDHEESTPSPVIQPHSGRDRIKSVSPSRIELSGKSDKISTSAMRFSLELPSGSILSHTEGVLKPQSMRLGPKPFYGSKK